MVILSNVDIEKELGENIAIYPFKKQNLRGSSYNLTVSKLAWNLGTQQSIYDSTSGKITIAKNSVALIQTNEAIWVSSKIAGTYHSKVGLVSQGLSHIGTTLDPEYVGPSLITVHNYSNNDIVLIAEQDTFVTLIFHYLASAASIKPGNSAGRRDALNGIQLTTEENNWLDKEFRTVPEELKLKLNECDDFKIIAQKREAENQKLKEEAKIKYEIDRKKNKNLIILLSSFLMFSIIIVLLFYLSSNKAQLEKQPWYDLTVNIGYSLLLVIPASFLIKLYNDLK